MSKKRTPNPQPTPDTNYSVFLVPRSVHPRLNALYDSLLDLGWRFDAVHGEWYTPISEVREGKGRLQYTSDHRHATIQPESRSDESVPGGYRLPEPLIRLQFETTDWEVVSTVEQRNS